MLRLANVVYFLLARHKCLHLWYSIATKVYWLEMFHVKHCHSLFVHTPLKLHLALRYQECLMYHFQAFPANVLVDVRSEEHTSELQSRFDIVCRLMLEKKN